MRVPTFYVSFYLFCDLKSYFSERNFAEFPHLKNRSIKFRFQLFSESWVYYVELTLKY
ncbi:hypothetical protein LEP1GSC081_3518 [Leptospira kirschneri str. H1]|uniref:Uncharacterized protein n=1 Tax=Leptospira kirschneri str. H1 TaxID=1049966 RepID=A0A0E2B765_9LEPT|nr:hypothetical protein LEP1GSC081_3518 [Leptospira kirschneri str. H1]